MRRAGPDREQVDAAPVVAVLEAWRAEGGRMELLGPTLARGARRLLSGAQETIGLGPLDELLVAIGRPELLAELAPFRRQGRAGYTWPNPHPLRKLTTAQVLAANKLHVAGGLSIRELGRRLYEPYGYSSAKTCAMALSDAFRRHGLERRDRLEAVRQANERLGYVAGRSKAQYKRDRRAAGIPG